MICNRCNKEGAKPYKYKDGGRELLVHLCDQCFSEVSGGIGNNTATRRGGILGMERKCPSCGKTLASIRRTGYIGCSVCFSFFKNELVSVIDKFQNKIISAPEKKQREMQVILLEDEYSSLLSRNTGSASEMTRISNRLREIEAQLASLGVRVDG